MATGIGVLLQPKAPLPSVQPLLPNTVSEQRLRKHSRRGWQAHRLSLIFSWVLWHFMAIKSRIHSVLIICLRRVRTHMSALLSHKCLRLFLQGQRVLGSA